MKKAYLILIGRTNKIENVLKESKLNFKLKYDFEKKKFKNYTKSFLKIEKFLSNQKGIDVTDLKRKNNFIKLRYSNCKKDSNVMVVSLEILSSAHK